MEDCSRTDVSPVPVLPYGAPATVSAERQSARGAKLAVAFALCSIAFNAVFMVKAVADWQDVNNVVRSRDPVRRVIKVMERGRPGAFPSQARLGGFFLVTVLNVAASIAILSVAGRCLVANSPPTSMMFAERLGQLVRWKLWLTWLGPVAAVLLGHNLSRVRDEFEVLRDWLHFHRAVYATASITAGLVSTITTLALLRMARQVRDGSP